VHVVLGDVLYLGRVCVTWLFLGCVCGYALDVYIACVVVSVCERERAREGGIPFIKIGSSQPVHAFHQQKIIHTAILKTHFPVGNGNH